MKRALDMKQFNSFIVIGLIIFFISCASTKEFKSAYNSLVREERTEYKSGNQVYTKEKLPTLNEESSLSDYLIYAGLNNPGLESAFNNWKSALEKVPQAKYLPEPVLSYEYSIKEEVSVVRLEQEFPWFEKLDLEGKMALQMANIERQMYEEEKLKLFYEVKKTYYEYYYVSRAISTTEENIQLMKYFEEVVRTKYKTDLATYSDVIKAQVELGKLENELLSVKFLQEPIRSKLNALLNRPVDSVIPFPKTIPEEKVSVADEQFIIWLKEKNPELKAIDFEIEKEKVAIERAKREYYPDIMLGIEYMDSPTPAMPEDNDYAAITGMISVNLPIWFGKYKAGVREAEARYTSVQKKRIDKENNLIADLKMALYELRDAERKIDLYKNTLIPKAEQSLQATQQTFAVGKIDFLDLIDAQRIFLEFKLSYERALTDSAQKLAELEMLIGRDVTEIKQGIVK